MLAKDAKPGAVIKQNDAPLIVESVTVQSPSARGGSTLYKFRARHLVTGQKYDLTCKGTDNLPDADFERREVTLMYSDGEFVHLLDSGNYEQYAVAADVVAEQMQFVSDGLEGILALIYDGQCVGMQIPPSVALEIVECDPGIKGNSATSRTKPAKLSTGYVVQVPEYMKQGEIVKVDTRTGDYLSRA